MTQLAASLGGDMVNSHSHVGAWYTLTKSAQRLGVPLNTFCHWVSQRRIEPPAKRGPHGALLYNEQQLERIAAKVHNGGKRVRLQDPNRYTLSETADLMGIGMDTLLTWRLLGFIPQPETNHGGRLCTYSSELVEQFVAQVPEIRERQENARRQKQGQALKDAVRPPSGRYSLTDIAGLANITTTTLWRYRKLGLISEPDQAGPGNTRSYSEQQKSDILAKLPKILEENQAKAILAMKAVWQNPELRKMCLEKVKIGNADPDVRRKRSESARNAMSEEQRRAAGERSRQRWNRRKQIEHAWKLSNGPKKRGGSTPGKLLSDSALKIEAIAHYRLQGKSPNWIKAHWKLVTGLHQSPDTAKSFLERHKVHIAQKMAQQRSQTAAKG